MKIGVIGQGFVGKNTADNFVERDFEVVRFALESEYEGNKDKIVDCDIVFIGVPTPTTPEGFDCSIVEDVMSLVGDNKIAVVKSTLLPGTTEKLQNKFTDKIVLFSPEFLCEKTAAYDVANPIQNIVGYTLDNETHKEAAQQVMEILPKSDHNYIVSSVSAELFKYAHNLNGYFRVILSNLLYEVGEKQGANWPDMKSMMDGDVMMSPYYNDPVHKGGRGAGGNCFIKDMAAFKSIYENLVSEDKSGLEVLEALEKKNIELLSETGKSEDLLKRVYG